MWRPRYKAPRRPGHTPCGVTHREPTSTHCRPAPPAHPGRRGPGTAARPRPARPRAGEDHGLGPAAVRRVRRRLAGGGSVAAFGEGLCLGAQHLPAVDRPRRAVAQRSRPGRVQAVGRRAVPRRQPVLRSRDLLRPRRVLSGASGRAARDGEGAAARWRCVSAGIRRCRSGGPTGPRHHGRRAAARRGGLR